jgi:oligoribonuclease
MPRLERFFHYRNLDVSTIKELARRWAPEVLAGLAKESRHQALDDVRESIRELGYYRKMIMSGASPSPGGYRAQSDRA